MGYDFISYYDRHVHLHDSTIWALRHFLMGASEGQDNIHRFFAGWQWMGPGVYGGTDLHEYIAGDQERVEQLKGVFNNARETIAGFGDAIPLVYLDQHLRTETAWHTKPLSTAVLMDAIDQVNAMVIAEEST